MGNKGPRLLLITGLPGAGKTCMAGYLHNEHGFEHFDVEARGALPRPDQIAEWKGRDADVAVSWGFMPGASEAQVRYLQQQGFMMVWLGGDEAVASRYWVAREAKKTNPIPKQALDLQLRRIRGMNLQGFNPVMVDPFTPDGRFKDPKLRAAELLALFP